MNIVVVCGVRDAASQQLAFDEKRSTVRWPDSRHNINPPVREFSEAVDLAPMPIDWTARGLKKFYVLAGAMMATAWHMGIPLRWGGDWDRDLDLDDQSFNDLGHFELFHEQPTLEA
jgi:hypothetical protein